MGKRPSTLIPRKKRRPAALQAIPTLTIMNHPDPGRIGQFARLPDLARGREVTLSRDAPLFKQPGQHIGEALGDPYISRKAIVLRPASDRALTIDCEHTNTLVEVGRMEGGPALSRTDRRIDEGAGTGPCRAGRVVVAPQQREPAAHAIGSRLGGRQSQRAVSAK